MAAALDPVGVFLAEFTLAGGTTWFVKHFGKQAVAASGIATRTEQLVLMPVIGLNAALGNETDNAASASVLSSPAQ